MVLFAQMIATNPGQVFLVNLLLFICLNFVSMCCVGEAFRELRTCLWQVNFSVQAASLNRQHQLPEAQYLHTLLLHSFSLFLFSEEPLLMSTHQQTKQMGWWKMNN